MKKIVKLLDRIFKSKRLRLEFLEEENRNLKTNIIQAAMNVEKERKEWRQKFDKLETQILLKDLEIEALKLLRENEENEE